MQKYSFNQLSLSQYIQYIYKTQVGIGVLTLPRDLAEKTGTDGWISILIGWIIAIGVSLIIVKTMEKHPNDTLFDLLPKLFGKWLGNGINLIWILYGFFASTVVMLTTIHVMKVWILPGTSAFLLMILFMIPVYMITQHGIKVIGRFAEFTFFITLWMPPILLFTLRDVEWLNLLPIGKEGLVPILTTVKSTVLSFLGFELAFLLYPFLKNKKAAYKGIIIANSLSMMIFLMVTLITYVRFSEEELQTYVWPTLNLLKLVQFPFLERLEIVFLSFYLYILFMTIVPYLHMAVFASSKLAGKADHRVHLRVAMMMWIGLSLFYVPTFEDVMKMGEWWGEIGLYFAYVFPVFLWMFSRFMQSFQKGRKQ